MATPMQATQKLVVMLQTAPPPSATYEAPCSINTGKEVTFDATPVEIPGGDCDKPDDPAWVLRAIDTFSAGIEGNGTLHTPDFEKWRDWFISGLPKVCRIKLDVPLADGGGFWDGEFVLTRMGLGKEGRGFTTFSASMQSNGEIIWNDAGS